MGELKFALRVNGRTEVLPYVRWERSL